MATHLAHQIDHFFHRHGSPIAGLGNLFVRFGAHYGVDPRLMASIVMKETEGGLTGTGRRGQYNLTGVGGVGHMRTYPGYKASIRDTARNLGSSRYRGKPLDVQTAMWVAGTPPSASTAPYTRDIRQFYGMLGGGSPNAFTPGQTPKVPRTIRTPGQPGQPAIPGQPRIPRVPGTTLQNPTELFQSLGDIIGTPWTLQLPDVTLPAIPGIPGTPGQKGVPAKKGKLIPQMPGQPSQIFKLLQAAQTVSASSAGYSKATARGPLKNVSVKSALDCSLSVAKVLQMAGLGFGPNQSAPVSGWMAKNWGKPGKGKYLTMYASDGHVFLEFKIRGKFYRFDTSAYGDPNQRSGPRIRRTQRSTEGFVMRHWPGL